MCILIHGTIQHLFSEMSTITFNHCALRMTLLDSHYLSYDAVCFVSLLFPLPNLPLCTTCCCLSNSPLYSLQLGKSFLNLCLRLRILNYGLVWVIGVLGLFVLCVVEFYLYFFLHFLSCWQHHASILLCVYKRVWSLPIFLAVYYSEV